MADGIMAGSIASGDLGENGTGSDGAAKLKLKTKKDIVRAISERLGTPQLRTKDLVEMTFEALIETLAEQGRVELRNFGIFQVRHMAARTARNPRTGESVMASAKNVVVFKPGKEMAARIQALGDRFACHETTVGPAQTEDEVH